jgi:hypothetical protein
MVGLAVVEVAAVGQEIQVELETLVIPEIMGRVVMVDLVELLAVPVVLATLAVHLEELQDKVMLVVVMVDLVDLAEGVVILAVQVLLRLTHLEQLLLAAVGVKVVAVRGVVTVVMQPLTVRS